MSSELFQLLEVFGIRLSSSVSENARLLMKYEESQFYDMHRMHGMYYTLQYR